MRLEGWTKWCAHPSFGAAAPGARPLRMRSAALAAPPNLTKLRSLVGPGLNLLGRLLLLAFGGELDGAVAVHRDVERDAVRIHGTIFRIRPGRGPRLHGLVEFVEPLLDLLEVLDLEAEMIEAARRIVAPIAQDGEREIAVAQKHRSALLGVDHLHVEHLGIEFGELGRVPGLDGGVANLRHGFLRAVVGLWGD